MKTNYETLVDLVIKAETAGKPRHELLLDVCADRKHNPPLSPVCGAAAQSAGAQGMGRERDDGQILAETTA
jgi:hypothetical protein